MFNQRSLCMILSAVLSSSLLTAISLDDDPNKVLARDEANKEQLAAMEPLIKSMLTNPIISGTAAIQKLEEEDTFIQIALMIAKQKKYNLVSSNAPELKKFKDDFRAYSQQMIKSLNQQDKPAEDEIQDNHLIYEMVSKYFENLLNKI